MKKAFFIDYENTQEFSGTIVQRNTDIYYFLGPMQDKIPLEMVEKLQTRGSHVKWIKSSRVGPNALDFLLAYYIGKVISEIVYDQIYIISKDQGYDSLINHLNERGFNAVRLNTMLEYKSIKKKEDPKPLVLLRPLNQSVNFVINKLNKINRCHWPKTQQKLASHIKSLYRSEITEFEAMEIVNELIKLNKITCKDNDRITYSLKNVI